jgi:SUKH-3 immunity protein
MTKFSTQAEDTLRRAGWRPGRQVPDLVESWKGSLMLSDGFEMFESAEEVLLEFGGLSIDQKGPGVTCAREPFTFDPTLAAGEGDRFSDLSSLVNARLYPLGEAAGGNLFWTIGENRHVYLLMNEISLLGKNIEEALERLITGLEAEEL